MADTKSMTPNRKALYYASIAFIVIAVAEIAAAALIGFAGGDAEMLETVGVPGDLVDSYGLSVAQVCSVVAVVMFLIALWNIFISVLSIRGAKDPHKLGFVTVIYGISSLISVVSLFQAFAGGTFGASSWQAFLPIFIFIICLSIRGELKEQEEGGDLKA